MSDQQRCPDLVVPDSVIVEATRVVDRAANRQTREDELLMVADEIGSADTREEPA